MRASKPSGKRYKCKECGVSYAKPQSLGGHVTSQHRPHVDLDRLIAEKKRLREMRKA